MKAMILAAGLGTRLQHLTNERPKALVMLKGKPLLEHAIRKLHRYGFNEIIINVHHFDEKVKKFILNFSLPGLRLEISDESDLLLDTGGGLLKASRFFNDNQPFLVHNVDIISGIDLAAMYKYHLENDALATLAVKNRPGRRFLLFDNALRLAGRYNIGTDKVVTKPCEEEPVPLGFSGISILSPKIFSRMTEQGKFSIISVYLRLSPDYPIIGYPHNNVFWMDLGKPEHLAKAERLQEKVWM